MAELQTTNGSVASPRATLHFKALDGLRGVAALAVVTFHFMEMAIYDYSKLFIGHGFLAVDFFFCLSGFVMGYAYDERIAGMGLLRFFRLRLIRLHPLVVLGSVLGLVALLADPFAHGHVGYSPARIAWMFVASILLIPYPVMHERSFNLFSLNAPAWSLFWEYIANLVFALFLYRLRRRWLIGLTMVAAVGLCLVGSRAGALSGGWSGRTFPDGGARVAFSFLMGLLIFRSQWIIRSRLGFAAIAVLLVLAFVMPYSQGAWVREAFVILLYFPFIIALGAGATVTGRTERVCTALGNLSYPLYMTHYSVIWIFGSYYDANKPDAMRLALVVASGVLLMSACAYAVLMFYDVPVRRFLSARRA